MVTGTVQAIEDIMTLEYIANNPISADKVLELSHVKITRSGKEKDLTRWKDCGSAHKQFVIAVVRELIYRYPKLALTMTKDGPVVRYQIQ
jgi:hypothetical protein